MVQAEADLLRNHGHEVALYQRHNQDIASMSKVSAAMASIWSQRSVNEIGQMCDRFEPDVIHGHNTFPLISPSLYWLASRRKIPVIQTLHNFRLLCPQAMFLREQKVCEDCLGKLPWRAVTRKCYRDSALQSAVAATMLTAHQAIGTYRKQVTGYIALSSFSRDKFIAGGLPPERIHVKPNFVQASRAPDWKARGGGLFIGRLSAEKGLDLLMDAVLKLRAAQAPLSAFPTAFPFIRVVGSGPLEASVKDGFRNNYLGFRSAAEVIELLHASLFLIAPSTCYETFGLVAVEAFSCGVPVIASAHGGLGELINDGVTGLLFKPGDAADLAGKIAWAQAHPEQMLRMGQAAYKEYLKKYTPETNYQMLMRIYQHGISATIPATQGAAHVT